MAKTYEPIASTTLGSAAASYTFTSIPGTFTDLIIVFQGAVSTGTSYVGIRFNSDTGSNYSTTILRGTGSAVSSNRYSSQTEAYVSQGSPLSTTISGTIIHVMSYANTNVHKTFLASADSASIEVDRVVSLWRSTSAITDIEVRSPNQTFAPGCTFALYGIKAA